MTCGYFITGTDTDIGKTLATRALMAAIKNRGKRVTGMKPVACGCEETAAGLRNEDALLLMQQNTQAHDYALINPYAFVPPVAPHIAAAESGAVIDLDKIVSAYKLLAGQTDYLFVEGIGGWCVPLDEEFMLADLVKKLNLPVIMVVGLKLGCINHTLLTVRSIVDDGIVLSGWIANRLDPDYLNIKQTLTCLEKKVPAPLVGYIEYQDPVVIKEVLKGLNTALLEQ